MRPAGAQLGTPLTPGFPNGDGPPRPRKAGPLGHFSTEHAAGAFAIGALVALALFRRGFRGLTVKLGS